MDYRRHHPDLPFACIVLFSAFTTKCYDLLTCLVAGDKVFRLTEVHKYLACNVTVIRIYQRDEWIIWASSLSRFTNGKWQMVRRVINTLRPRQSGCHFPDDVFKYMFLNKNWWILIRISLLFVPMGPIDNIVALVQIQATGHYLNKWSPRLPTHALLGLKGGKLDKLLPTEFMFDSCCIGYCLV